MATYQYSIDTNNLPFTLTCPDTGYYTSDITVLDSIDTEMNFALQCKNGFDLAVSSIWGRFIPGDIRQVNIQAGDIANFYGVHCNAGLSGTVTVTITGSAKYVSPALEALTPTTVVANTITWDILDFDSVNFLSAFNIIVQTDTTAVIGSHICFALNVSPTIGDYYTANNSLDHCFVVRGSFDPNNKESYPEGNTDTSQHWLTYTINFQNTGTDTARHVYVTDTLDANLDASSFQLLAYSHEPLVQLKENAVRFNFPNIYLPDSNINEPTSHGYVQYKIKLKDNLPIGTIINNTASIYFDFNEPVVTNTTTNTIALVSSIADTGHEAHDFVIYPNPATSKLFILSNGTTVTEVNIYTTTGSLVSQTKQPLNNYIDISKLATGLYVAEIKTKEASVRRRWVKM